MSGQTLLVFTIICLANAGMSQPIESAKDEAPTPAPTPAVPIPAGKPPEEAADQEAKKTGHVSPETEGGIDKAINLMNNLNDLFETIVNSMGDNASPDGGGAEAKEEETAPDAGGEPKPAAPDAGGEPKPAAPAAGDAKPDAGDTKPAPAAGDATPAPDAGTAEKPAAKKQ